MQLVCLFEHSGAFRHLLAGEVDTINQAATLNLERMKTFQFTLPSHYTSYEAFYAPTHRLVNFSHLAANISITIYLLFFVSSICFTLLLATIYYTQISSNTNQFSLWNTMTATIPCFRNQTPALGHKNSTARAVV